MVELVVYQDQWAPKGPLGRTPHESQELPPWGEPHAFGRCGDNQGGFLSSLVLAGARRCVD
eukprot:SAG11_NODE_1920_length_4069_cov_3.001511_1_plen_60_part_10